MYAVSCSFRNWLRSLLQPLTVSPRINRNIYLVFADNLFWIVPLSRQKIHPIIFSIYLSNKPSTWMKFYVEPFVNLLIVSTHRTISTILEKLHINTARASVELWNSRTIKPSSYTPILQWLTLSVD